MIELNDEQRDAVGARGNIVVTACPGSGKTRVLTARVVKAIEELGTRQGRVIALTYTNRAADEIIARLDGENIETERIWSGTIHAFALEWIAHPVRQSLHLSFEVKATETHLQREIRMIAMLRPACKSSTASEEIGDCSVEYILLPESYEAI